MPEAISVDRPIAGRSEYTIDTSGLRFEFCNDWEDSSLAKLHPQIEELCRRSSDPAQFHALPMHIAFDPKLRHLRRKLFGVTWRTLLIYSGDCLEAVLFLREATLLSQPTGYFRGFNARGDTLIVAEAGTEEYWLSVAVKLLLESHRAFLMLMDRDTPGTLTTSLPQHFQLNRETRLVRWQHPLQPTFDATIASFGHRTRRNLRHALQQVKKNGWVFKPKLHISELAAAMRALRSTSTHPFTARLASHRLRHSASLPDPLRMGLLDANGQWLSCIAGYRNAATTSVLWQSNLAGSDKESLCTIMRALLLLNEVERGTNLLRFVGGSNPHMEHICTPTDSVRLALGRPGLRLSLVRSLPPHLFSYASETLDATLLR